MLGPWVVRANVGLTVSPTFERRGGLGFDSPEPARDPQHRPRRRRRRLSPVPGAPTSEGHLTHAIFAALAAGGCVPALGLVPWCDVIPDVWVLALCASHARARARVDRRPRHGCCDG